MQEPVGYRAYRIFWQSLDWLYPPSCVGCGRRGILWCDECTKSVNRLDAAVCPTCGIPQLSQNVCHNCLETPPNFTALRSWARFDGRLRKAIHQLKYRRNVSLGQVLAIPMIDTLNKLQWPIDLITPIPLGLARMAERGYNQASLLAKPIALYFRLGYQPGVIKRLRETQSQVGLSRTKRQENVSGAFFAYQSKVKGKKILLIDDVITSGSTMNAAAAALCEAGAEGVYGFSLARAGLVKLLRPDNGDEGFTNLSSIETGG